MRDRTALVGLLALLLGVGCGPAPRPNVLVLVLDTLRTDHVGAYGYARETTPRMDRRIAEGVRFEAAIAHSSWSAPSHVSIVTGVLPHQHGVLHWGNAIPPSAPTLAERLRAHGFRTGYFSSHGGLKSLPGFERGFDESFRRSRDDDPEVLAHTLTWIRAGGRSPWYAHVILMGLHAPYDQYPPEYDERYFTDVPPGGERTWPFLEDRWEGEGGIPQVVRIGERRDVGFYVNRYDRALRQRDELVGAFLDSLAADGTLDTTLVALTSDHGESFGEHDYFAHGARLHDTLVRVPLVLHLPGRLPPAVWREPVQLVDIVPTVLGIAGLPVPSGLAGLDLSPHLAAGSRPPPRVAVGLVIHAGQLVLMARSDRHKLIVETGTQHEELYDLLQDPGELENLAAADSQREVRSALLASLDGIRVASEPEEPPLLAPDAEQALRELGYLAPEAPAAPPGP